MKVKIISTSSPTAAERIINNFLEEQPNIEVVDIKMSGDGHSTCVFYLIMYKESAAV